MKCTLDKCGDQYACELERLLTEHDPIGVERGVEEHLNFLQRVMTKISVTKADDGKGICGRGPECRGRWARKVQMRQAFVHVQHRTEEFPLVPILRGRLQRAKRDGEKKDGRDEPGPASGWKVTCTTQTLSIHASWAAGGGGSYRHNLVRVADYELLFALSHNLRLLFHLLRPFLVQITKALFYDGGLRKSAF